MSNPKESFMAYAEAIFAGGHKKSKSKPPSYNEVYTDINEDGEVVVHKRLQSNKKCTSWSVQLCTPSNKTFDNDNAEKGWESNTAFQWHKITCKSCLALREDHIVHQLHAYMHKEYKKFRFRQSILEPIDMKTGRVIITGTRRRG